MRAHLYTAVYRYIRPLPPPRPPPAYRGATEGPGPPSYVGSCEERPCPDLGLCAPPSAPVQVQVRLWYWRRGGRGEGVFGGGGGLGGTHFPPSHGLGPKGGRGPFPRSISVEEILRPKAEENHTDNLRAASRLLEEEEGGGHPSPTVVRHSNTSLGPWRRRCVVSGQERGGGMVWYALRYREWLAGRSLTLPVFRAGVRGQQAVTLKGGGGGQRLKEYAV